MNVTRHQFRVHTPNLLREILAGNPTAWPLRQPIAIFADTLGQVAARAIELDDPELNKLMLRLTLYEQADPASPDYNPELLEGITEVEKPERKIVERRGGYFVTGEIWSGPWRTREAAELAMDGEYTLAHQEERDAIAKAEQSA